MKLPPPSPDPSPELAVLVSGGCDSAVLVGEAAQNCDAVYPLYFRCGHLWETVELDHLRRFLDAIASPALRPLTVLEMPVGDLYPGHWSLTGAGTPGADSPDEAVCLPGRNVLLLSKAMLWCHLHDLTDLALGTLASNPFPDASWEFCTFFGAAVNEGIGGRVRPYQPYWKSQKCDVLRRGRDFPLELTFSCIHPREGRHCGTCNKCAERRRAFAEAALPDRTPYFTEESCSA
jgi:7-cyano-7-deazaguanine synthase